MKHATILTLYLAACFAESQPVDPVIEGGTGGGTSGGSEDTSDGNGPVGSWSGSGTSTDSTSTSPGSLGSTGGESTDDDGSTGSESTDTGEPEPYVIPCDECGSTCVYVHAWSVCGIAPPCDPPFDEQNGWCVLPCGVDSDCPAGTECVHATNANGMWEACLWPA